MKRDQLVSKLALQMGQPVRTYAAAAVCPTKLCAQAGPGEKVQLYYVDP
jgi:hypothetical protein